ncbi:MAG: hypothetical protein IJ867_02795 [Clostridia bacterium]|nr:hypothetical protein [Clostridia bacterium]
MINSAMPILKGWIEDIWFDDELFCSTKLVCADVRLNDGHLEHCEMIRDDLCNPEVFDVFWKISHERGIKNLKGNPVNICTLCETEIPYVHRVLEWVS